MWHPFRIPWYDAGYMEQTIHAQIRAEWNGFLNEKPEIVPGYCFSQYDTIKKIHLYLNSQFENQSLYNGRRKLFFNITKFRCEVATRMLNFDTKDLRLIANNFESSMATFLLSKEFQSWMKKSVFARTLNQLAEQTPRYGSFVLKKTPDGASKVDLRRLALDPTVERIWQSPFVIQKHYMTASQIRAKKGWNEYAKATLLSDPPVVTEKPSYEDGTVISRQGPANYYEIFERYGEVRKSWITGDEADYDTIVRGMFVTSQSCAYDAEMHPTEEGLVLFSGVWNKPTWPFYDFHYYKTEGRWLGIGIVEDLFASQERQNEMANQKRISMEIGALHLYQTNAVTILQNLLSDFRNGDIIKLSGAGTLSPVATEQRNLAEFRNEQDLYDQLADRLSFAYDAQRGEKGASSTPATNAVLQNNAATGIFDFKKENIGIDLRYFLLNWVLPQLKSDLSDEHILRFTGTLIDFRKLDDAIIDTMTRAECMKRLLNGTIVTEDDKNLIENQIKVQLTKRGGERWLKVAKGFYKDVQADFDFLVTNEQMDVSKLSSNLFTVLSAVAGNPEILKNPLTRAMLKKWAEMIGIPSVELDFIEMENSASDQTGSGQPPLQLPPGMPPQGQGARPAAPMPMMQQ